MAALTIALFFLRYWRHSGDRLFLYFSLAFVLEGIHRVLLAGLAFNPDGPQIYLIRLLEYGLILFAIVSKNRASPRQGDD
jgi:hypothetical protein